MKTKSVYSTITGARLARLLAEHIVRTEPVSNRDECIDELRQLVCSLSDAQAKAPVSAFIVAEDAHRLASIAKNSRYQITIAEE